MKRVQIFVDAGHLRELLRHSPFEANSSENQLKVIHSLCQADEEVVKVLYYDSPPFKGELTRPDGRVFSFNDERNVLEEIAQAELLDVRRGALRFRGWRLNKAALRRLSEEGAGCHLEAQDLEPHFEQKCVDMRIGLDIAATVARGKTDRILLLTADMDMVPVVKYARKNEVQVVLFRFSSTNETQNSAIFSHADFIRTLDLNTLSLSIHENSEPSSGFKASSHRARGRGNPRDSSARGKKG